MIQILDKHNCCGCNACVQKCPKQCISMHEDEEGFLYPIVDFAKCIDCHLCEKYVLASIRRSLRNHYHAMPQRIQTKKYVSKAVVVASLQPLQRG